MGTETKRCPECGDDLLIEIAVNFAVAMKVLRDATSEIEYLASAAADEMPDSERAFALDYAAKINQRALAHLDSFRDC